MDHAANHISFISANNIFLVGSCWRRERRISSSSCQGRQLEPSQPGLALSRLEVELGCLASRFLERHRVTASAILPMLRKLHVKQKRLKTEKRRLQRSPRNPSEKDCKRWDGERSSGERRDRASQRIRICTKWKPWSRVIGALEQIHSWNSVVE